MIRGTVRAAIGALLVVLLLVPWARAASTQNLRWAAGSQGAVNAEAAIAISGVLRRHGLPVYAVASGGTLDSLLSLVNSEADFANGDGKSMREAWKGVGPFQGKQIQGFSQVMSGYTNFFFFVTLADSGITRVEDFAGKTVNGHVAGSIINFWLQDAIRGMEAAGIVRKGAIRQTQISISQAIDALVDKKIDVQTGYAFAGQLPTWLAQAVTRGLKFRVIPAPTSTHDFLRERGWVVHDEPALQEIRKLDPSLPASGPFYTSGIPTIVVATDRLSTDQVYRFLKTIFDHLDEVKAAHNANRSMSASQAIAYLTPDVPVHPGAAKFYKEAGVWRDHFQVAADRASQ